MFAFLLWFSFIYYNRPTALALFVLAPFFVGGRGKFKKKSFKIREGSPFLSFFPFLSFLFFLFLSLGHSGYPGVRVIWACSFVSGSSCLVSVGICFVSSFYVLSLPCVSLMVVTWLIVIERGTERVLGGSRTVRSERGSFLAITILLKMKLAFP